MDTYVLGHTARERDRLDLQGRIYRDATRRAFVDAGIERGMQILDIGCGSGDVTRLAAELVGEDGSVHGVDRNPETIVDARRRTSGSGIKNVSFAVGDAGAAIAPESVDGVVGRFVLMHQSDPGVVLARAARSVRPGGVIVFVESHMTALLDGVHSFPTSTAYDELVRWKCRVVASSGADTSAGLRLYQIFRSAGLPDPSMRLEAPVVGGVDSDYYRYMAESVRSMLPQARALGIDGLDEQRVDRIERDLREETVRHDGVLVIWPVVAAWCRLPAR